jgi:pimeloyl-ACP methyl ester carboxylesterase
MKKPTAQFFLIGWMAVLHLSGNARAASSDTNIEKVESRFATFGTNKVHYVLRGSGQQTVVFVHGWGGNTEFWKEQVPAFQDKAKIILVDLPGHGQSDKPKADYTMDFLAEGVLAVLGDAKIQKATLIGHSMGTPVICRAYKQVPEKVAGLVAVDGLLRPPNAKPDQFEPFVAPYRTPEYREHTTRFITAMFPNSGTEKLRDWVLEQVLATPQRVLSGTMDGMFKPGQPTWDLEKLSIPVLAIHAPSPMWNAEYQAYVHSLSPRTDFQIIEGSGHFVMLEKPAEFNKVLLSMLEKFHLVQ